MKRTNFFFVLLFIFASNYSVGCDYMPIAPGRGGTKNGLPAKDIPLGLGFNIHIKGPEEEWNIMRSTGARFIRADFTWSGIERERGKYNFEAFDKLYDALTKNGIRPIFILDYSNRLYPAPETTEEGRAAFAKWAAVSAEHFKGKNVIWEIWNEPNVGFWKGEGELNSIEFANQYVQLVKKTVPAMRAVDPDCYILGGSVSCLWRNSFRWIDEAFKQGLLQTGINALSVHPYGYPHPELCMEGGIPGEEGYALLREKMLKSGAPQDFPVVNTEVGYSTRDNGVLRGDTAELHRAMLFVRTYLVDQMCDIKISIWYNWDANDAQFHKVRSSGPEPLPIFNACKNMNTELTGFHFVDRINTGNPLDYVAIFMDKRKRTKIVAWTTPKRGDTQDKAIAHEVTIPFKKAKNPEVRDLFGKPAQAETTPVSVKITLTASPVYIDLNGKHIVDPGI